MKTRLLIILVAITIGVIVASTVGTMEYQSTYNQNCNSDGGKIVGFLKCMYINEDFSELVDVKDARNKVSQLYETNPLLDTFYLRDAVIGYGIGDGFLIIYILDEYYNSVESQILIIETIVDVTDKKVGIEFMSSRAGEPVPFLEQGYEFCVENEKQCYMGYEFCVENEKECYFVECADNEIYHRGICMTQETKERAESIGEKENEN